MLSSSESNQLKKQFNTIKIIYYALVSGLIIFFSVALIIIQNGIVEESASLDSTFKIVVPIFGLVVMFVSRMIYSQKIANINASDELVLKIEQYRTLKVISWAIVESGCFFALVAAIVTLNYLYVAIFILLFGYFIMMRPSVESFILDMRLNNKESDLIRGK